MSTRLQQTNFDRAFLLHTLFLNVDLSKAIHLETVTPLEPSTVGMDTFECSRGKIPDLFLRKAGVSEQVLASIRSAGHAPFEYQTCFISYSSRDQHFVDILYQDLSRAGVSCWYAPESLSAGENFAERITQAVQSREKLLVVLSKHSVASKWVGREVTLARQREGNGKRKVLVPISLDSAILTTPVDWAAALRRRRHVRSFEYWKQPPHYHKQFKELLEDLLKK